MTVHGAPSPSARHHSPTPHEVALVQRLRAVGSELAATPSEEHRARTRARLVAMAAVRPTAGAPRPGAVRSPQALRLPRLLGGGTVRWRSRVAAGLAAAALTVGALGGVLAASQGATPGDLLYPVKRGGEQAQLALAGDTSRGRTLLEFAGTRLTELTALTGAATPARPAGGAPGTTVAAAGPDADVVVDVLAAMDRQTTRGASEVAARSVASRDPAPLADLGTWAAGQQSGLAGLDGAVPAPAGPALTGSTDLAGAVAERARALVASLSCTTGPATMGVDELGPRPVPCSSGVSRTATRDTADPAADVADAAVATGTVPAQPSAAPTGPDTAGPAAARAGTAAPGAAVVPPAAGGGPAAPGGDRSGGTATAGHGGGATAPSGGSPGRDARPGPPPTPRVPTPAPARPGTAPVVDVPLPLCVTALGSPLLC
jgi:hypothetical protein